MRYQYTSTGFRSNQLPSNSSQNYGVKLILTLNITLFFIIELSGHKNIFIVLFGLVPNMVLFQLKIWQLFTYMFIHGGIFHIFFNMLVLWIFGKDLENKWGTNDFLFFYLLCGVFSGFMTAIIGYNSLIPIVGASGAMYGILVAYGYSYPNKIVYLYGLFPIKVKYMVLALGIIAFIASLNNNYTNISHITHLFGMIIGLVLIYYNIKLSRIKMIYFKYKMQKVIGRNLEKNKHALIMKKRVNQILDKINNEGWENLDDESQKYLYNASKQLYKDYNPN